MVHYHPVLGCVLTDFTPSFTGAVQREVRDRHKQASWTAYRPVSQFWRGNAKNKLPALPGDLFMSGSQF
jgi:hypothetical protein